MAKDTCYLTDEEIKIRNEIVEEKNKTYIDGFGYVAPAKTKTIIVDSNGSALLCLAGSIFACARYNPSTALHRLAVSATGGASAVHPFTRENRVWGDSTFIRNR